MATIGFDKITFGVHKVAEGTGLVTIEKVVADKAKGGAIDGKITGLGATTNTVYASNVPFFIAAQGVSSPKLTLQVADLLDNDIYSKITGVEDVDGYNVVGANTKPPYVSVMLQTATKEGVPLYMGLTKGKFAHPDMEVKTAEDKGVELNTDEIEGDFISDERGYVYITKVGGADVTEETVWNFITNQTPSA